VGISDDELFRNANSYRLHQDTLRWTLLAGYAAFLVGIIGFSGRSVLSLGIGLVAIGNCYMFILGVENFFYNLFSEYVKDCESKRDAKENLRTLRQFTKEEARRIGPFHHSFFFAMLIVLAGNTGLTVQLVPDARVRLLLFALNVVSFLVILLGWRVIVFPYIVLPIQRIFDVTLEERNLIWRFFSRRRSDRGDEGK
jgi:hypothetical protein